MYLYTIYVLTFCWSQPRLNIHTRNGGCTVITSHQTGKQRAVLFPDQQRAVEALGQNLLLARKRRKLTQKAICERTGLNYRTVARIEKGDPGVSLGHYVRVLAALSLMDDFIKVGLNDKLGHKLQDIRALGDH
jgi:DNA-binding XRE family transcriptional regulator